ncbi:TadE/TadG family type IV pilus assembly protein [Aliivibrio kagoshimensis]|uniref:TadE/TadG family type IV pilus assembly protein n=1 Tax=Aliivibrio kagoshimensis TaxID=2910230 RepID=UPI003D14ABE9
MKSFINRKGRQRQRGVVAIEFVIGFFSFWLMCVAWLEMSYMSYISAISDLAIAEAARSAKVEKTDYLVIFNQVISSSTSVWEGFVDGKNFSYSVQYLNTIEDLVGHVDNCVPEAGNRSVECGNANNSAIAIYRISYDFKSIFSFFMDQTTVFSREAIVIQEYERDQFQI